MFDVLWDMVGRGLNGWHTVGVNASSSGGTLEEYVKRAREGALVYDAIEADKIIFIDFVVSGPICSPELPPDKIVRFSDDLLESAKRMIPKVEGSFKQMLTRVVYDTDYHGLDRVSVGVYGSLLRKIPGMKIGYIREGAVEWIPSSHFSGESSLT